MLPAGQGGAPDGERAAGGTEGPQSQVNPLWPSHRGLLVSRCLVWRRYGVFVNHHGVFSFPRQGAKKAAVKILKNFDEAITVDIASLDPESLYQRPYAG